MNFIRHILVATLVLFAGKLSAEDILGGHLTYECIGGDQYIITLQTYENCFGNTPPPDIENIFFEPECGFLFSATAQLQSVEEISDLCAAEIPNSSCNGGLIPGTRLITYVTEPITLDEACLWTITWGAGDWNYFQNVDWTTLPNSYFETTIDLTNAQCAESINTDGVQHVPYVCAGDPVAYNMGVTNPEGYDLSYTITDVLTDGGAPAPYFPGYTGTEPIPGITLDPLTGDISFTAPPDVGSYAVGVLIEMFDGGTFVGSVLETISFVVRPCNLGPTVFDPDGIESISAGGTQLSATEAEACIGDSLCITVSASNPDIYRSIVLDSDFESLFPGATFTVTGVNPAVGELCLLADETYPPMTTVTINATDDDCDNPGTDQLELTIYISPNLSVAFTDTLACVDDPIALDVSGDTDYTWSVISGDPIDVPNNFSCTDCGNPLVSPAVNTVYEVIGNNVPATCTQRDTITVNVSLSAIDTLQTVESCAGMDGAIDLTVLEGSGNYQYTWTGPNGFSETTQDINGLDGGLYSVTIVDLDLISCDAIYTVFVDSIPAPDATISNDTTICAGECVDVVFNMTGTAPYDLNLTNLPSVLDVADGYSVNVCPNTTTTYTLNSVTDANIPSCTVAIGETMTVTVRPVVTASFIQPANICVGDDIDLEFDIDQAGTFDIEYTDGTDTFTIAAQDGDVINVSPNTTTTYTINSVAYQDIPNCPNTTPSSVTLTVNPIPTASLSQDATICAGDQATLTFSMTGNGPFDVEWNDGVNTTNEVDIADGYTVDVSPANTTTYCIVNVSDASTPACAQTVNSCVEITVNPLPEVTLSQDETICEGDEVELTIGTTGTGPFDVTYETDAANPVVLNDISDGEILTLSPVANTQYCIVSITDSNNPACTATGNECVDITVNTPPTVDITGSSSICEDECVDIPLTLTGTGTFTVSWEIENVGDGVITPQADIVGANDGDTQQVCSDQSIIVRATAVSDSNNPVCSTTAVSEYTITVVDYSTIAMSQDSVICDGGDGLLSFEINGAGGPYDFTFTDGAGGDTDILGVTDADLDLDGMYFVTVNPAATTTYTLTSFTDASNNCTQFFGDATITVTPNPTTTFTQDALICPGDDVDITIGLTGVGPFDVTINDGTDDTLLEDINDGYLFNVTPDETTTYTLSSVVDMGSVAECSATPLQEVTITLAEVPEPLNVDTICDATSEFYQIEFEISGGDPLTYSVTETGAGAGAISAGPPYIYTSGNITSGDGASFDIEDADACGAFTLTIDPYTCPVQTFSGTMDITAIDACETEEIIAIFNNDAFLDPNDQLMFILHDNPGDALGLVYALDCDDTGFNDADTPLTFGTGVGEVQYETVYYISAVAGNDDGTGDCVDLNNPNISVAVGTPVVFHEQPEAEISGGATFCEGDSTLLTIDFSGVGPWTYTVALDAVDQFTETTTDNPVEFYVQGAGTYTVSTVENEFCTGVLLGDAIVVVNPNPTVNFGPGGAICEGASLDVDINLTGAADWNVDLVQLDGDGVEVSTTNIVINASPFTVQLDEAGDYYITQVSDANGCQDTTDTPFVNLVVNELPEALITMPDSSICEGSFIDIPIQLFGNGPWDVELGVAGVAQPIITEANDTLIYSTDQPGLIEVLSVTDANACAGLAGASVNITTIAIPTADAGPDITACSEVDATIGTPTQPNLSYSWDPSDDLSDAGIAEPVFNKENTTGAPEIYVYTLTVSEGYCQDTDDVQITLEPSPIADAGPDQTICYGEATTLEASGGIACVWEANPSLDDPNLCMPQVNTLVTDTFIVQVEGANGCFATDSVIVNVPDELILTVTDQSEEVCFEACDGFIDAEGAGGTEPYTFTLTYPDNSEVVSTSFQDLCAGDYTLTLSDAIGCTDVEQITITELPEYVINDVIVSADICFGSTEGTIEVNSPEAVSFTLNGSDPQDPNIADGILYTDLPSGDYTIVASNSIGCLATEDVSIGSLNEIYFDVDDAEVPACYQEAVDLGANANGGAGDFTYFWMTESFTAFDQGQQINFVPTNNIVLLAYAVDANGCSSDTLGVEVSFNEPFVAELSPSITQYICLGESITLSAELSGGNGFPAPTWTAIYANEVVSNQTSFTVTPDNDELYELTVTDGCTQPLIDTVSVVVMDLPNPQIGFDVLEGCVPVEVVFTNETESDMIASCEWDLGDGNIIPACLDTVTYTFTEPGSYDVTLTVTSNQGCSNTATLPTDVSVYPYPNADFTWEPLPPTILENELQFINQTTLGSTFEWDFANLGSSILPNPTLSLPFVDQGGFPICLIATSTFGCRDTVCKVVDLQSQLLLYVPTAFTPDGDGINEVFIPVISGVERDDYTFRIFDRWGNMIFETNDIDEPWQGDVNGGDHFVQNDVYVWQILCRLIENGEDREFYGHVTVVR